MYLFAAALVVLAVVSVIAHVAPKREARSIVLTHESNDTTTATARTWFAIRVHNNVKDRHLTWSQLPLRHERRVHVTAVSAGDARYLAHVHPVDFIEPREDDDQWRFSVDLRNAPRWFIHVEAADTKHDWIFDNANVTTTAMSPLRLERYSDRFVDTIRLTDTDRRHWMTVPAEPAADRNTIIYVDAGSSEMQSFLGAGGHVTAVLTESHQPNVIHAHARVVPRSHANNGGIRFDTKPIRWTTGMTRDTVPSSILQMQMKFPMMGKWRVAIQVRDSSRMIVPSFLVNVM